MLEGFSECKLLSLWLSALSCAGMCGEAVAFEFLLQCLSPADLQQTTHVQESHLRGAAGQCVDVQGGAEGAYS